MRKPFSIGESLTEQTNHFRECQVSCFRIETRTFIAREGVFGWIQERLIPDTGTPQRPINRFAPSVRNVWVLGAKNHEKFTANFFGAGQRSGICVLTKFAIMDAGAVVTDRRADIGLEPSTECEVAADTKSHGADFSVRDLRMFGKPVQTSAAIGIEMRDRSLSRVLLAAHASVVIEWNHCSRRFDTAINFRRSGNESITGQSYAGAQQWRRKLKNVGVAPDAGIFTFGFRCSDEGSHRGAWQRNVRVLGIDDQVLARGRFWRRSKSESTLIPEKLCHNTVTSMQKQKDW